MSDTKTCFREYLKNDVDCDKQECRNWISCSQCNNCSVIGALNGPFTHEQISNIVGLTRLKVYRIEREALKKIIKKHC